MPQTELISLAVAPAEALRTAVRVALLIPLRPTLLQAGRSACRMTSGTPYLITVFERVFFVVGQLDRLDEFLSRYHGLLVRYAFDCTSRGTVLELELDVTFVGPEMLLDSYKLDFDERDH